MEGALAWAPDYWAWWILAGLLLIVEVFAPGFFFLWLGVAAGVVGLVLFFVPDLAWQAQVLAFAVLSVAALLGWRTWGGRHAAPSDHPYLNRRALAYIGRQFTLEEPIVNGHGRVRIGDTYWPISGSDLPAGSLVRVTAVEGPLLKVMPVPP